MNHGSLRAGKPPTFSGRIWGFLWPSASASFKSDVKRCVVSLQAKIAPRSSSGSCDPNHPPEGSGPKLRFGFASQNGGHRTHKTGNLTSLPFAEAPWKEVFPVAIGSLQKKQQGKSKKGWVRIVAGMLFPFCFGAMFLQRKKGEKSNPKKNGPPRSLQPAEAKPPRDLAPTLTRRPASFLELVSDGGDTSA